MLQKKKKHEPKKKAYDEQAGICGYFCSVNVNVVQIHLFLLKYVFVDICKYTVDILKHSFIHEIVYRHVAWRRMFLWGLFLHNYIIPRKKAASFIFLDAAFSFVFFYSAIYTYPLNPSFAVIQNPSVKWILVQIKWHHPISLFCLAVPLLKFCVQQPFH